MNEAAHPDRLPTAAWLPTSGLVALASLRHDSAIRVHQVPNEANVWVTWPPGRFDVVACLRPVQQVQFYENRNGQWFRFGSRVPTTDGPPGDNGLSLDSLLVPEKMVPQTAMPETLPRVPMRLVRGGAAATATAVRCAIHELQPWAETALSAEIAAVHAARCGEELLLRGEKLPKVPNAARYWGSTVLVPLGFRVEPDLPRDVIRAAAGVQSGEVLLMEADGIRVIPPSAFAPLTRAAIFTMLTGNEA